MNNPLSLFWIMLRAALLSTTGTGNFPAVHQDLLSRGWATDGQFAESLAIGQISPGPTGLWVISLGYFVDGFRGAALTLVAIVRLPPLSVLALAGVYRRWGTTLPFRVLCADSVWQSRSICGGAGSHLECRRMERDQRTDRIGCASSGATRRIPVAAILALAAIVGIAQF